MIRASIIRDVEMLALLGACAMLSACFPVGFHRSETPDIWRHVPDAGRAGDTGVLVLTVSEESRDGSWARIAKNSGRRRIVQPPIFAAERELKDLSAKLTKSSVDMLFFGYFGGWVERSDERIVEACVIWPDGRFLALGDRTADTWGREARGSMTAQWQSQLLETISSAEVLTAPSPPDACPYAWARLNWDYATRQRVISFLRQVATATNPK